MEFSILKKGDNGMSLRELQNELNENVDRNETEWTIGFILFYGTWNSISSLRSTTLISRLVDSSLRKQGYKRCRIFGTSILVDQSEETIAEYIGENNSKYSLSSASQELPVLSIYLERKNQIKEAIHHVHTIPSSDIIQFLRLPTLEFDSQLYLSKILRPIQRKIEDLEVLYGLDCNLIENSSDALRIFIAGDRSSVGKSSICLGIIGSLLAAGYSPDTLAYIKPATQSESTQLIELYCNKHGISCVPIGPLVYYRGFTRAFLAGDVGSTSDWLHRCATEVDRIARGKRVVLVDGVGFPAVGSICGTSNATMAMACGYPQTTNEMDSSTATTTTTIQRYPMGVVLVGGSGVGAAVDAFNLNASYFEQACVPVMGGIFNKLPTSGFYSLENCKEQITAYFRQCEEQIEKGRHPLGFVPLFPRIAEKYALTYVDEYIKIFRSHVDVDAIINAAQALKDSLPLVGSENGMRDQKRIKLSSLSFSHIPRTTLFPARSRQEIETKAITAGAAPSA